MQLGSGTFDLLPGIAYLGKSQRWDWGAHAGATIRLGDNKHDYRLGNVGKITAWIARGLSDQWSTHVRLDNSIWKDIHGADSALSPGMVPTADPSRRGGQRTDVGVGFNLLGRQGGLEGHRATVEFRVPVYQDLHGPQLETDWILSVGWQKVFD